MAKDLYHEMVRIALENEGWKVTDDPYYLKDKPLKINYEIDLAAERLLIAEKENEKIAIEVKSFLRASLANEFHGVFGQYLIYQAGLLRLEPERKLFLAIPQSAYLKLQEYLFLLELINEFKVNLIIFDEENTTSTLQWELAK